jgi:GNAT superfamily N-acetyltransferase
MPEFDQGDWWLALHEARVIPSTRTDNLGYFSRVSVLRRYCGHGLQLRMMRAIEARARAYGWSRVVSNTTDNIVSANNFIRAGYRLYQPQHPWAWPNTLYWRKSIK